MMSEGARNKRPLLHVNSFCILAICIIFVTQMCDRWAQFERKTQTVETTHTHYGEL